MSLIEKVSNAYARQRALDHETMHDALGCILRDPAHPNVWDTNHISNVRASTAKEIDQM